MSAWYQLYRHVGLPEDEEDVEETDTGDEPLRDRQPTQTAKRF
jgi:hypothetical protein